MIDERNDVAGDGISDQLSNAVRPSARQAVREFLRRPAIQDGLSRVTSRPDADGQFRRLLDMVAHRIADAPRDHEAQVVESVVLAMLQAELDRDLLKLAVRRFLADQPGRVERARSWLESLSMDEGRAQTRPTDQELAEAEARLSQLSASGASGLQATMMADAARSGSFDAATGALADFLIDVGHPTSRLELE